MAAELTQILRTEPGVGSESVLILRILSGSLQGQEAILMGPKPFVVGTSSECTLRLPDPSVSRRHLEIINLGSFVSARDLGSTNGSYYEGSRFERIDLGPGAVLRIGETELQIVAPEDSDPIPPSQHHQFGGMLGSSRRMREVFAVMERAAKSDVTVLVTGETGTGKEVAADAIHQNSRRRDRPFVVVDCASIPGNLIESELFGHVKGAYTNAVSDREGAFEQADGGTIFLDEIGELPPELQPRLLRVLESRRVKRVGANGFVPVDVRVIAATNRDLQAEVEAKRFRSDLYFRLAVIRVRLPALRDRRDDIPILANAFLARHNQRKEQSFKLSPDMLATLSSYAWPGNVRELRNVIAQAASLSSEGLSLALRLRQPAASDLNPSEDGFSRFFDLPYKEARRQAIEAFETAYVQHVLEAAGGNVSRAAELAEIHRNVLHRILARSREDSTS